MWKPTRTTEGHMALLVAMLLLKKICLCPNMKNKQEGATSQCIDN